MQTDDKYNELGQHMFNIIDTAKNLRPDLNVVFLFHPEDSTDPQGIVDRRIKTVGKLLADKYTPEASFGTLLHTTVNFDKDGKPEYMFVTNRTPEYPAKSPWGAFESLTIPNDLQLVLDTLNKYYKEK